MRPLMWAPDEPMLNGIIMDVVHVMAEILFIPDSMLPEPLLPYAAFVVLGPGRRNRHFASASSKPQLGEFALDATPTL